MLNKKPTVAMSNEHWNVVQDAIALALDGQHFDYYTRKRAMTAARTIQHALNLTMANKPQ